MVEFEIFYEGQLRTRSRHGPSASQIETDAPTDNHGKGERFSPTDLVSSALGSCMLTVMGIRAEREGWNIDGARARVVKHMVAEPTRRIGRLEVFLEFPPGVPETARPILEGAARGCPVRESIHPEIELDLQLTWA